MLQNDETSEVSLAPASDPTQPPAPEPLAIDEAQLSKNLALQSSFATPIPAVTSVAWNRFPLRQDALQSAPSGAGRSRLSNSEPLSLLAPLRLPMVGDRADFSLTIDGTIQAADKVIQLADDAMRAAQALSARDTSTPAPPHDLAVHASRRFEGRPAPVLAILTAAVALLITLALATFETRLPSGASGPGSSLPRLIKRRLEQALVAGAPAGPAKAAKVPAPAEQPKGRMRLNRHYN
jgi:hypothetical protein